MEYNRSILEKVEKYKRFFADERPGQLLGMICPYTFDIDYSKYGLTNRPFNSWDYATQAKEYAAYEVAMMRAYIEETRDLDNDYIPAIAIGRGTGVNSAYFSGAEVTMGVDTSWAHPVIDSWEDLDKLKIDPNNFWIKALKEMVQTCVDMNEGDYAVSTICNYGPGDMVNGLRGNEIFYDLYDYPDEVNALYRKATDAIIWLERELKKITGGVCGGTVTANVWFPGNAPYLSEDFSDLCSADLFREFGRNYTQEILNTFGGAYIHHHAKGFHIHQEIASLQNLKLLEISWDPNCPRPVDHLEELFEMHQGPKVPLMIRCLPEDIYKNIETLKKGRVVMMINVQSLEEAKEVMAFLRKHSTV